MFHCAPTISSSRKRSITSSRQRKKQNERIISLHETVEERNAGRTADSHRSSTPTNVLSEGCRTLFSGQVPPSNRPYSKTVTGQYGSAHSSNTSASPSHSFSSLQGSPMVHPSPRQPPDIPSTSPLHVSNCAKSVSLYNVSIFGVNIMLDRNEKDNLIDLVVQDARKEVLKEHNIECYKQIMDRALSVVTPGSESPGRAHIKNNKKREFYHHQVGSMSSSTRPNTDENSHTESPKDNFARFSGDCAESAESTFRRREDRQNDTQDEIELKEISARDSYRTSNVSPQPNERRDRSVTFTAPILHTGGGLKFSRLFNEADNHRVFMERRIKENQIDIEYSHKSLSTRVSRCMHDVVAAMEMPELGRRENVSEVEMSMHSSYVFTSDVKSFTKTFTFSFIVTRLRCLLYEARDRIKAKHLKEKECYFVSVLRGRVLHRQWKRWRAMFHAVKHFRHVTFKKVFHCFAEVAFEKKWKMYSIVSKLNTIIFRNYRLRRIFQVWRTLTLIRTFVYQEWIMASRSLLLRSNALSEGRVTCGSDVTELDVINVSHFHSDTPKDKVVDDNDLDLCPPVVLYALPLSNLDMVKQSILDFLNHRFPQPVSSPANENNIPTNANTSVVSASNFLISVQDHLLNVVLLPEEIVVWFSEQPCNGLSGHGDMSEGLDVQSTTFSPTINHVTYTTLMIRRPNASIPLHPQIPERLVKQHISEYSLIRPDCSINVVARLSRLTDQRSQRRSMYLSCVSSVWMAWQEYLVGKRKRNNDKEVLRKFLKSTRRPRVLARCLDHWKCRQKASMSTTFYCVTLKSSAFIKWRNKAKKSQEASNMTTICNGFLFHHRKRVAFKRWKDRMRAVVLFESIGTLQALIHRKTMLEVIYKMQSSSPRYLLTQLVKCAPLSQESMMQIEEIEDARRGFPYRSSEKCPEYNISVNHHYSSFLTQVQYNEFTEVRELATISWLQVVCFNSWRKYMIRSKRYKRFRSMHLENFAFNLCRMAFFVWKMRGQVPWMTVDNTQTFVDLQQQLSRTDSMELNVRRQTKSFTSPNVNQPTGSLKFHKPRSIHVKGDSPLGSSVTFSLPNGNAQVSPFSLSDMSDTPGSSSVDIVSPLSNQIDSLCAPFPWIDARHIINTFVSADMANSSGASASEDNILGSSHSLTPRVGFYNIRNLVNMPKIRLDSDLSPVSNSFPIGDSAPMYIPRLTDLGLLASAIATNASAMLHYIRGGTCDNSLSSRSFHLTNFRRTSSNLKRKSSLSSTYSSFNEAFMKYGTLRNENTLISDVTGVHRESSGLLTKNLGRSKIKSISLKLFNEEVFSMPAPAVYVLLNECRALRTGHRECVRNLSVDGGISSGNDTPLHRAPATHKYESVFSHKKTRSMMLDLDGNHPIRDTFDGLFTRCVFRRICHCIVAFGMVTSAVRRSRLSICSYPLNSRALSTHGGTDRPTIKLILDPDVSCQAVLEDVISQQEEIVERIYKGELSRVRCNRGICDSMGASSLQGGRFGYLKDEVGGLCGGTSGHHSFVGGGTASNSEQELVSAMLTHQCHKNAVDKERRQSMLCHSVSDDTRRIDRATNVLVELLKVAKKKILEDAKREDQSWKEAMIQSELIQLRALKGNKENSNIDVNDDEGGEYVGSRNSAKYTTILTRYKLIDEHAKQGRYRTVATFTESMLISCCDGGMTVPVPHPSSKGDVLADVRDGDQGNLSKMCVAHQRPHDESRGNYVIRQLDQILEYLDRLCRRDYKILYKTKLTEVNAETSTRRGRWLRKVGGGLSVDKIVRALTRRNVLDVSASVNRESSDNALWPKGCSLSAPLHRGKFHRVCEGGSTGGDGEASYRSNQIAEEQKTRKEDEVSLFLLISFLRDMVNDATCITIESRMRNRFLLSRYTYSAAAMSFIESLRPCASTSARGRVQSITTTCSQYKGNKAIYNKPCAWTSTCNSIRDRDALRFRHYFSQNDNNNNVLHHQDNLRPKGENSAGNNNNINTMNFAEGYFSSPSGENSDPIYHNNKNLPIGSVERIYQLKYSFNDNMLNNTNILSSTYPSSSDIMHGSRLRPPTPPCTVLVRNGAEASIKDDGYSIKHTIASDTHTTDKQPPHVGDHIILIPSPPKELPRPLLLLKEKLKQTLNEEAAATIVSPRRSNSNKRYTMPRIRPPKSSQTGDGLYIRIPLVGYISISSQHIAFRAAIKLRQALQCGKASRGDMSNNTIPSAGATLLLSNNHIHSVKGVGIIAVSTRNDAMHYMKFLL